MSMKLTEVHQLESARTNETCMSLNTLSSADTLARRARVKTARGTLTACLLDRNTKGPVRWTRGLSEVAIGDYRQQCRQLGNPHLFYKKDEVVACSELTKADHELRKSLGAGYHRNNGQKPVSFRKSGSSLANITKTPFVGKQITLSELHRILKSTNLQDINHKYRFHISSNGPHYPSIHVMVPEKAGELPPLLPAITGLGKRAGRGAPRSQTAGQAQLRSTAVPAKDSPSGDTETSLTPGLLSTLEERRLSSVERTRKWLENMPEDSRENVMNDSPTPGSTALHSPGRVNAPPAIYDKNSNLAKDKGDKATRKDGRKRVKFGTDNFLYSSPDEEFLFQ